MKIEIKRRNSKFHFQAVNESGNTVDIDANPSIGGEGKGVRPMELLLAGLGSCSGIDIISILNKQKINPEKFSITVDGEREDGVVPSLFKIIRVNFSFEGEVDTAKAKRAVELSMQKYCSVSKTLEPTAQIEYAIIVNGQTV
ncbi:MAG: OsmC family protein [Flavobacteriales bacterium]